MTENTQNYIRMLHEQTDRLETAFGGKPIVTLKEAADFLHKSEMTLMKDPTFPVKQSGGRWNVSVVRLANWLIS